MSIEVIVEKSTRIERLLKDAGYQGRGLRELISQAAWCLDDKVVRACRKVASIRNKALHEHNFYLSSKTLGEFNTSAEFVIESLIVLKPSKEQPSNNNDSVFPKLLEPPRSSQVQPREPERQNAEPTVNKNSLNNTKIGETSRDKDAAALALIWRKSGWKGKTGVAIATTAYLGWLVWGYF